MLRPYQTGAVEGLLEAHRGGKTPLCVMATGTGKTHVFVEYARLARKRVMIIAERSEIVMQAHQKVVSTGETCDMEMGSAWSSEGMFSPKFVCASIQTLNAKFRYHRRMDRFDWTQFGLIVIDEAHHAVAKSYLRLLDTARRKNPHIKVMGVTATPDRLDKKSMLRVFDSVPYRYEMPTAIKDGYLVPIKQKFVHIETLDFTKVNTRAGDLNPTQLDAVMQYERNLHGVVSPTMQLAGDRPTLIFAASIKHAERMTEIMNRHRPDCARVVHGKTDPDQRRQDLSDFEAGEFQFLVNVQIATEGWDCPPVACVAVARPTKSRALYTQMVGRGTRTTVHLSELTAAGRKAQIASSNKPDCLVLDFVGNSGEHQLVCTIDILAEQAPVEVREFIKKKVKEKEEEGEELSSEELHEMIDQEIEKQKREMVKARVEFSTSNIEPFSVLGIKPKPQTSWSKKEPLTAKQRAYLERAGVRADRMPVHEQHQVLHQLFKRARNGLATVKQMGVLFKMGYEMSSLKKLTKDQASEMIDRGR